MRIFDQGPVMVTGSITMNRARVLWTGGRLYLFRTLTEFHVLDAPEPPEQDPTRGRTAYRVDSLDLQWQRSGCSCNCAICSVPKSRLLEVATEGADA